MQTIDEVRKDPAFMHGLEIPEFKFSVFLIMQAPTIVKYFAFWEKELLFSGTVEPAKNALTTACQVLDMLTRCAPGNERQQTWTDSEHCKELKTHVKAFFDLNSKGHKDAELFFKMRFAL